MGRTVDDDASLFTIYFTVADSSAENTHVSIGDSPTDFKFAPGAGGSVEASTTPGLITIGGGGSSVDDGSDSGDGGAGDGGTTANEAPTLALVGDATVNHEAGTTYSDAGASASDAEDDNTTLTGQITVTGTVDGIILGTYTLTYDVTDSDGAAAQSITRTVNVVDTTPPVITLSSTSMSLNIGDTYVAPTVTVDDFETLTATVGGDTVDTSTAGTYVVTYDATDSSSNEATQATLTVTVTDSSGGGEGDGGNEVTIPEGAVALIPDSVTWDGSGEIEVPLRVTNFDGISGVQFTLEWDASVLDLVTEVNRTSATEVKVTDSQGVTSSKSPFPVLGPLMFLDPFFEGKNFNYPVNDLTSGSDIAWEGDLPLV